MGWCHEFGPQIRDGCDHPMVAGADACSCPECGVECRGRSSGCVAVWAAGPKEIKLRRPSRESALHRVASNGSATNGSAANGHAAPSAEVTLFRPAVGPPNPSSEDAAALRPVLNALRAEISVLSRKVDQIHTTASSSVEGSRSIDRTISAVDALPGRLRKAVGAALQEQNRAIAKELESFRTQGADELRGALKEHAEVSARDRAALMHEFDARFSWFVTQLSDRFVILGNAMAQIGRRLDSLQDPPEGPGAVALMPLLVEVNRLAEALAHTVARLEDASAAQTAL